MRHSARLEAKIAEAHGHDTTTNAQTPPLMSPPGIKTPPTDPAKRAQQPVATNVPQRIGSQAVDANALSMALHHFEEAGRQREATPGESPKRKRQRVYGDRSVKNGSGIGTHAD